jgi:hypothetical protein
MDSHVPRAIAKVEGQREINANPDFKFLPWNPVIYTIGMDGAPTVWDLKDAGTADNFRVILPLVRDRVREFPLVWPLLPKGEIRAGAEILSYFLYLTTNDLFFILADPTPVTAATPLTRGEVAIVMEIKDFLLHEKVRNLHHCWQIILRF